MAKLPADSFVLVPKRGGGWWHCAGRPALVGAVVHGVSVAGSGFLWDGALPEGFDFCFWGVPF